MNEQSEGSIDQEMDWGKIVASTTSTSPMAWLTVVHLRLSSGDVLGADKALENVLVLNKEKKEIDLAKLGGFFFNLALAAGKQGRWDLVLKGIGNARELGFLQVASPDQKRTLSFEMAKAQAVHLQYKEAIESLKYVLHADPNSVEALTLLGHAYFQTGDFLLARETYVKALLLGPSDEKIAILLDEIERVFPVDAENDASRAIDPFIRAALEFVLDHWLTLYLEKFPPNELDQFQRDLLSQVPPQLSGITVGHTNTIILKVSMPPLTKELIGTLKITIPKDDANPVHRRFVKAVQIVLDKIFHSEENKTGTFIQERKCLLSKGQIARIRRKAPITGVSFISHGLPIYLMDLRISFARKVVKITRIPDTNEKE